MSTTGTNNRDKAGIFFRSVEVKVKSSQNRQEVFEQFVGILAAEAAEDLAVTIMENYGEVACTYIYTVTPTYLCV